MADCKVDAFAPPKCERRWCCEGIVGRFTALVYAALTALATRGFAAHALRLPYLCRDVLLLEPAVPFIAVLCRHPTLELARGDIRSEMKFPFPPSQGNDTAHQLEFFVHRYALDLRNSELALQSGIAVGRDITRLQG